MVEVGSCQHSMRLLLLLGGIAGVILAWGIHGAISGLILVRMLR